MLIRKAVLEKSKNAMVQAFAYRDKFTLVAQESDLKQYPNPVILREMNTTLFADHTRDVFFNNQNHKYFSKKIKESFLANVNQFHNYQSELRMKIENGLSGDELSQWINDHQIPAIREYLEANFPGEMNGVSYVDLILQHYTQGPMQFTIIPLAYWAQMAGLEMSGEFDRILANDIDNNEIKSCNYKNLYSCVENGEYKVYLEARNSKVRITDRHTGRKMIINGGVLRYELRPEGFCYAEDKSYAFGTDYYRIFTGEMPYRLNALLSYPLMYRLEDAYQSIYRDFLEKKTVRNVLGWPIKAVFELLPRVIASTARWARDSLVENFPDPRHIKSAVLRHPAQLLTLIAIAILGAVEGVGELAHATLSRISSPVRSFKEAWAVHPALGVLSALVSIGGTVALGIALAPVLTAIGLGGSLTWFATHTGVIGQFCMQLGAKLTGLLGLSVLPEAVGVSALAAGLYAMVVTPLRSMAQRVMGYKAIPQKEEVLVQEPDTSISSSDHVIKNQLLAMTPAEQTTLMSRIQFSDQQAQEVIENSTEEIGLFVEPDNHAEDDFVVVSIAPENKPENNNALDTAPKEDELENRFHPK